MNNYYTIKNMTVIFDNNIQTMSNTIKSNINEYSNDLYLFFYWAVPKPETTNLKIKLLGVSVSEIENPIELQN